MTNEYKRPTNIVELPSGKKVEVVAFLTQEEIREVQSIVIGEQKISAEKMADFENSEDKDASQLYSGMEFNLESLAEASKRAKRLSIKKLIEGEIEYGATDENIRNFFNNEDGEFLDGIITEMLNPKKKLENAS